MKLDKNLLSNKKIVIIGDPILDKYISGETNRISPEAPVPILKVKEENYSVGGAANVASNLANLGINTNYIFPYGEDLNSKVLLNLCLKHNVNCLPIKLDKYKTPLKVRNISMGQQLLRTDYNDHPYKLNADLIIKKINNIKNIDLLVLSDYQKGTLHEVNKIIEFSKDKNIKVIIDPKGDDFSKYKGSYLIKPNFKEFELIVGKISNLKDLEKKAFKLISELDINALLITKGNQGMSLIENNKDPIHIEAEISEVYDVTGAGDTVLAALAASIVIKNNLYQSSLIANVSGSLAVKNFGTFLVSNEKLNKVLIEKDTKKPKNNKRIFVNIGELCKVLDHDKKADKKIVFTNGCFDILHIGHLRYLKEAKSLGDILIVGLNDDQSIKNIKGKTRPINNINVRSEMLSNLDFIDYIVTFSEDTPKFIINKILPDLLVKGGDYKENEIVGAKKVLSYGGEVKIIPLTEGFSTSNIIKKITDLGDFN